MNKVTKPFIILGLAIAILFSQSLHAGAVEYTEKEYNEKLEKSLTLSEEKLQKLTTEKLHELAVILFGYLKGKEETLRKLKGEPEPKTISSGSGQPMVLDETEEETRTLVIENILFLRKKVKKLEKQIKKLEIEKEDIELRKEELPSLLEPEAMQRIDLLEEETVFGPAEKRRMEIPKLFIDMEKREEEETEGEDED